MQFVCFSFVKLYFFRMSKLNNNSINDDDDDDQTLLFLANCSVPQETYLSGLTSTTTAELSAGGACTDEYR